MCCGVCERLDVTVYDAQLQSFRGECISLNGAVSGAMTCVRYQLE